MESKHALFDFSRLNLDLNVRFATKLASRKQFSAVVLPPHSVEITVPVTEPYLKALTGILLA